jgi:phosphoribosylformylglycinamidine cyclo-ligase
MLRDFSYVIDKIPRPQPIFNFLQEKSRNSDKHMYENFNMGLGFVIFMPEKDIELSQRIAADNGLSAALTGYIEAGPKQVIIKPNGITFGGESLAVR